MQRAKKLDHINLKVPNLESAIKFYTETMEFHIRDRYTKNGRDFVFVTDGNVVYELGEDTNLQNAYFDHVAYESKDIQADYDYYKALNPKLLLNEIGYIDFLFENGVYYFFIKGEGNEKIEFCQKKKRFNK